MKRIVRVLKHFVVYDMKVFRSSGVNAEVLRSRSYSQDNKIEKRTPPAVLPAKFSPDYRRRGVHVNAGDTPESVRMCAHVSGQGDGRPGTEESTTRDATKPFSSIPGPKPLPLVGNMFLFTALGGYPLEKYWEAAQRLYERYGPVVKVARYFGGRDMVVVYRPEDTKKLFQAEGRYPQRPVLDILTHYRSKRPQWFTSPGLVPGNGPEWRRLRSVIHPLLRREVVIAYRAAQTEVADDLVRVIASCSHSNAQNENEKPLTYIVSDLLPLLFHYTLEAVGVVSLGTRLGCLTNVFDQREEHSRARNVISANSEALTVLGESIFTLPLYKIFPTKRYRRLANAQDTIFRVVQQEVSRRKEDLRRDPEGFPQRHPFLAALMTNPDLSPQDLFLLLAEVFQGGIDATATTLGFSVYFLAGHPAAQDQLLKEVQDVQPATHSLQGLPYLRAVVQETLRLRPSASARSRVIQEDTVFSGYFVPAQTYVISPPVVSCHDPGVFLEPHKFLPERWLPTSRAAASDPTSTSPSHADLKPRGTGGGKIDPYTVLAFGHGARMCPGRRLAEQEIHLALIQLVKSYKMEFVKPGKAVGQVMRLNMMPDAPFAVAFTPRL